MSAELMPCACMSECMGARVGALKWDGVRASACVKERESWLVCMRAREKERVIGRKREGKSKEVRAKYLN